MGRITAELLRRRAEHNDGCLSDLKEVALHQQEIERIELLGDCCRQLEIIYLSNNYISKIEGLHHLKYLTYLNLAVNNITRIEGLEGCEALERLDLTLNFVADLSTVNSLQANPFLQNIHLTGNPCTKIDGYRAYVIHALPQLTELDGEFIIRAERIAARQCEVTVSEVVREDALKVHESARMKREMMEKGTDPFPPKFNAAGERVYGHSPEERLQMLREQQREAAAQKAKAAEPVPGSISALHKELNQKKVPLTPEEELAKYGRHLMRNEAKVQFSIHQDGTEEVVVRVQPGKFISTTLLNVEVDITCIRVYIKGKLLQLPTDVELSPDGTRVQRSTTTGELVVTVPMTAVAKQGRRGGASSSVPALRAKRATPSEKGVMMSSEAPSPPQPTLKEKQAALRTALLFPGDHPPQPDVRASAATTVAVEVKPTNSLVMEVTPSPNAAAEQVPANSLVDID